MIRAFKLTTGEEVVAEIVSQDKDSGDFTLSKPRTLMITPGEKGQMHLSLVPWMISAQDPETQQEHDSVLYKSSLVGAPKSIPQTLEKGYMKNVSSIQLL